MLILPEAKAELSDLPSDERAAMENAFKKLQAIGSTLGYPHSSAVVDADHLRELRPRQGRSPHRALYRQIGTVLVIAAIGPEANVDKKRFKRAVQAAEDRLNKIEER